MPIYEYRCNGCRRKVTVLTLRVSEAVEPVCEHCGSTALTRLMSRFAMVRSEDDRLDSPGDIEDDPRAMREWAELPDGMFAEAWVSCIGYRPAS